MSDTPISIPDPASRFFSNYLICLDNSSIPKRRRRWYVKRVEEFIAAQKGHKIKDLTSSDLTRYFEMLGRQNRLSGWQFAQYIDAIRILYCKLLATSACQSVTGLLA